jgi:hypothetical protein
MYKNADFTGYKPPENYELSGQKIAMTFGSGEKVTLAFSNFNAPGPKAVLENNGEGNPYSCFKISDMIYFVSYMAATACVSYVLDTERGLAVRVISGAAGTVHCHCGVLGQNNAGFLHSPTAEPAGNTVDWTFGTEKSSVVRVAYSAVSAEVSFPLSASGAPDIKVLSFTAYKIEDGVYLQNAHLQSGSFTGAACFLSNFKSVLSLGNVFGTLHTGAVFYDMVGAYGRIQNK